MKRPHSACLDERQNSNSNPPKKQKSLGFFEEKTAGRERDIKVVEDYIRCFLFEKNDVNRAISALEILKIGNRIEEFLKKTNYSVFTWAMEHESLPLLHYLVKNVRAEYHFLMISHNNYRLIKHFIHDTLKMKHSEYESVSEYKKALIKEVIEMSAELPLVIKLELSFYEAERQESFDQKTLLAFKEDINNLMDSFELAQLPSFA